MYDMRPEGNTGMTIHVNGEPYRKSSLRDADFGPGTIIAQRFGRRVYRVLCQDGNELVVRNVRHPGLFDALPLETLRDEYCLVTPLAE